MKTLRFLAVLVLFTTCIPVINSQTVTEKSRTVDFEALAQKIVNQCAVVKEGEVVLITGGVKDIELLENIAVNVSKVGAFPLITVGSDRLTRRFLTEVPEKYDTQFPLLNMKLLDFTNVVIGVSYGEDPGLLADISPERLAAISNTNLQVNDLAVKKNIRQVSLGNGLYPTEALAKQFGMTKAELSDIFWKGVNTDYSKLTATGEAVKAVLKAGKEVQITNSNGTDLKVRIENRPVFASDGITSVEDMKGGLAAMQVYLPAGEVYVTPVAGTAEGIVVVDRDFYQGKLIEGITLTFKGGKLISMTAKSGLEPLKAMYDAAGTGKEEFSFIDIGINPDVKTKPGSMLISWIPSGMLTIGIGNNIWAGGENKTPYGYNFFIPGSTVKVDGKTLVENGVLVK
jgi:leucyl aminopeptidase (aminopeptidase T)